MRPTARSSRRFSLRSDRGLNAGVSPPMTGLLKALGKLLTRDLTGQTWTRESDHPYFLNLLYFGSRDPTKCYWEAEVQLPAGQSRIGVTMIGTPDGPTVAEEQFCKTALSDLDSLFNKCRSAFEPEYLR